MVIRHCCLQPTIVVLFLDSMSEDDEYDDGDEDGDECSKRADDDSDDISSGFLLVRSFLWFRLRMRGIC